MLTEQGWFRRRWPALRTELLAYGGLSIGVTVLALGLNFFLVPNKIASGGISGLAVVIFHLFDIPMGITMLILNIPLFLLAVRVLGAGFGARSVYGFVLLSIVVDATGPYIDALTTDAVLASIYGGVLAGVGIGITYKFGGSTGGTAIAARLIDHYFKVGVGRGLLYADGFVLLAAAIAFGPELALYGLLAVFIEMRVIDLLEEGAPYAKAAFIITDMPDEISAAIIEELKRGVTAMSAKGMYTQSERNFLFITVYRDQVVRLKQVVHSVDPAAFVVISDVHEALGEGFRDLT